MRVVYVDFDGGNWCEGLTAYLADHLVAVDATDPLALYEAVTDAAGAEADVTVNLVNVGGSELGTILLTRETGTILFFSMATSFPAASLSTQVSRMRSALPSTRNAR